MFSANKRFLWYLQIPSSLRRSSIVLTSYLFSLLLIERVPRCSSALLGKKKPSTSAPPHYIPLSTTFLFSSPPRPGCCVGKWLLQVLMEKDTDAGRKPICFGRKRGLTSTGSAVRQSCSCLRVRGALKTMSARGLGLASRKRMHAGVCCAEEMISTTWPDLEQR